MKGVMFVPPISTVHELLANFPATVGLSGNFQLVEQLFVYVFVSL